MKVVVTGAGGFIGRKVFSQLEKAGHEAIKSFVDLTVEPSRYAPWLGADAVIHCAGFVGGIALNQERPADLMDLNLRFLMNSLSIAYRSEIKRFVNLGSVCSYPDIRSMDRSLAPVYLWDGRPEESNAPYGIAKRVGLELVDSYRKQYGMIGNNLILANVYGPGARGSHSSHIIPAMAEKLLNAVETGAQEVEAWGTGDAVREFLYVDDAAKAVVTLGLLNEFQAPVNIGSGQVFRIRDIVSKLAEITGFKGEVRWDESKPDSRTVRRLDTSDLARTGFAVATSMDDGLRKTVEYIANERRNSRTPAKV